MNKSWHNYVKSCDLRFEWSLHGAKYIWVYVKFKQILPGLPVILKWSEILSVIETITLDFFSSKLDGTCWQQCRDKWYESSDFNSLWLNTQNMEDVDKVSSIQYGKIILLLVQFLLKIYALDG